MRVLFDENVPRPLRRLLHGHEIAFVEERGWRGRRNGELLDLMRDRFEVMVTADGNLAWQQNLIGRRLSVVVLPTNNIRMLQAIAPAVQRTLGDLAARRDHVMVSIGLNGARIMRSLDDRAADPVVLPPVPPAPE